MVPVVGLAQVWGEIVLAQNFSPPAVYDPTERAGIWTPAEWDALVDRQPDLAMAIWQGGRFYVYPYCISVLLITFKRSSGAVFRTSREPRRPWPWILRSMLFGWWGIPWGPIWTLESIRTCSKGGVDVTGSVIRQITKA